MTLRGLLVGVVAAGAATGIGLAAQLEGRPGGGALLVAAVVVAAYVGGLRSGLAAAVLSFVSFEYFFLEPKRSLKLESRDEIVAGVVFVVCAIVVATIVERLRRAQNASELAYSELARSETRYRFLAREQLIVAELGRQALTGSDPQALLEKAVVRIGEILGTNCVEALRAAPDGRVFSVVAQTGLEEALPDSTEIPVSEATAAGRAFVSEEPVETSLARVRFEPPWYLEGAEIQTSLAVPIRGVPKPWGVLAAYSSKPDAFSAADVSFMRAVANVAGAAILRREAEDRQREARDELGALIEASPLPIVAYDALGTVTLWNPAAERVFGWTPDEAIGTLIPFVQEEMLDEFHSVRERALAGQSFSGFETVRRRKDGTLIDVSFSNAPVRDAAGRVRGVMAVVADITERRKAERALRLSEERLRLALEASQAGTWEWDVASGVVRWSDRLEPLHGLAPGSFDGSFEQYQALIHPDDQAFVLGAIEAALERDADYDVEFRIVWPDGSVHWVAGQGQVIRGEGGEPERMIGLARDVTDRKRREEALAFTAEASEVLSSTLDYERTLREVARLAVPRLADCCVVDVMQGDGEAHQVAVVHVDPAKEALVGELEDRYPADPALERSVVGSVLRSRKPLLLSHVDDATAKEIAQSDEHLEGLRRLRIVSILIVPLVVRGQTLGAVTLLSGESGRHFDSEDLRLATELARHAALSVDNARLYRQRSRIAATLQQSLLPPTLPEIPGFELAARYYAAGEGLEVGGDFYDAFQTGEHTWAIVIGDVCGKGTGAAAITGLARHTLRASAFGDAPPSSSLEVLNDALLRTYANGTYCTVVVARLSTARPTPILTLACGGHPRPILVAGGAEPTEIGTFGTLVGFFDDPEFTDVAVDLNAGDAVLFYTDGLVEGRGRQMAVGLERLTQVLRHARGSSATEIADLMERMAPEDEREAARDDTAFIVLRVEGDAPPA